MPGSEGVQGVCGSESAWKGREGREQVPARRHLRSGSPCHLCPNGDTSQSKRKLCYNHVGQQVNWGCPTARQPG